MRLQWMGWFAALLVAFAGPVAAQEAPDTMVKRVSGEVLNNIRSDREIQQGNARKIGELIESQVVPHVNVTRMTALAVGPAWRRATPQQQKDLAEQFKTLLVRTYSAGIGAFRDQQIDFRPLRMQPNDTEATVRSEVKRAGAEPIGIDYSMEKVGNEWKIYDVTIGGVSLVTTYRDTFREEIRQGGIEGLIKTLSAKNRELMQKSAA